MKAHPRIKLLHTADLHFGDGYWEHRLAHAALTAVVDAAMAEQVDVVLIAGDLFDRNSAPLEDVRFVLDELGRLSCPVVILPGNHDALEPGSVYLREEFMATGSQIRVLLEPEGQVVSFPKLCLAIWGRPVVDHNPGFNPLAGIPRPENGYWHVAIAHGMCPLDGWDSDRSSLVRVGDIANAGWHYLALGHVHSFRDVSEAGVLACYSGTPVEADYLAGGAGTAVIVEMDDQSSVRVRRVNLKRMTHALGPG